MEKEETTASEVSQMEERGGWMESGGRGWEKEGGGGDPTEVRRCLFLGVDSEEGRHIVETLHTSTVVSLYVFFTCVVCDFRCTSVHTSVCLFVSFPSAW